MSDRPVKISCRGLWKVYGPKAPEGARVPAETLRALVAAGDHIGAARDVSFDVRAGEIFVIMGLSGSGKSTVVRCLSRLVEPSAGEILFDGQDLLKATAPELIEIRRHKMGMVFQGFGLLPHLSVLENVAFPLRVQGAGREARLARAREMIALVGLEGREDAFPRQLSGGQQQRVGIARSLAIEPDLWFLDEPFSALDPLIRSQMQDEFLRLQKMLMKTIVFITHDFLEALKLADRIAIMKDGAVVQIGTPSEIVMRPADAYVTEFTRDVPRGRLIRAGDCVEPLAGPAPAQTLPAGLTLDEAIPRLAAATGACGVADADGAVIGQITPASVIRAMAAGAAP